jgi:hypothetical protein
MAFLLLKVFATGLTALAVVHRWEMQSHGLQVNAFSFTHEVRISPLHTQAGYIDPMEWLEARTERKSVMQPLIPPVVPSTVCHSGGIMSEGTVSRAHSTGPQVDPSNEKSDCYLQVRVERSIVVNTEPEDGGAIEELKSKWGPEHGV